MRVLAAMSGGVDSSVAAALALEAGHDVVGVTLKQWEDDRGVMTGCCTVADAEDARRVAAVLDIPYYVLDYRTEFRAEVVERFIAGYGAGRTPNPCVECNRRVRFSALFERMADLGCNALATGHHARVARRDGAWRLLTAVDGAKDQTYVLHMLDQDVLGSVIFPVGEMTKDAVREHARRLGLRTASKPDSQDLCFVGPSGTRDFLRRHGVSGPAGPIVDQDGTVVGAHDGAAGFTVGQRRGLGVALGEPRYVTAVDTAASVVRIGPRSDLGSSGCEVDDMSFVAGRPLPGARLGVKVRSRGEPVPAQAGRHRGGWRIVFGQPIDAVAVGQAAVLYQGDEVVGGGPIARVAA